MEEVKADVKKPTGLQPPSFLAEVSLDKPPKPDEKKEEPKRAILPKALESKRSDSKTAEEPKKPLPEKKDAAPADLPKGAKVLTKDDPEYFSDWD